MWINIPLGALAIASAVMFLHLPKRDRPKAKVDVLGMMLLAIAAASLVLVTSWGGNTYAWGSTVIIVLMVVTVVAGFAFVRVELAAEEPVMPMYLFKNRNFRITTSAGLLTGVAMFGALAYMPTYLQMVTGVSATKAGLLMIPMMGALLITSIISGQYVSRTGKYKSLPIAGAVFVGAGLYLLSTMSATQPVALTCSYLAVMGIGLGLQMQILVLIVQNSFPVRIVGTATAANNFFRQIGASLGAAVVGSLFTSRLVTLLAVRLPAGSVSGGGTNALTPSAVQGLPAQVRDAIVGSYSDALAPVFLYMVPLAILTFVLLLFIREDALATTIDRGDVLPESMDIDPSSSVYLEGHELVEASEGGREGR